MAQELLDGEFWLPPEFLNDDDILTDFPKPNSGGLTSPVESVFSSTETESDEEDFLSQKLSNTTLKDNYWKLEANLNSHNNQFKSTRVIAGSPQSTLCGCKNGSSRGSPNCVSPPATATEEGKRNQPFSDLLYAAAGEVARMRMIEEAASRYYNLNKTHHPIPPQSARKTATNPNLHYRQLQLAQFQKMKHQQLAKQQYLQMMVQRARNGNGNGRPVVPAPAWSIPQQNRPAGSGMRAVFLGNPNTKRETTGTGVFLPRQPGAPTEPFKKRGCSTVLLPDRVVQALDLKLEAMGGESKLQSRCNGGSLASDYEAEMMYRRSVMMVQQNRNNQRQQAATMNEFRLPQEWTY